MNSSAYYYYRIVANVSGKLTELSTEENASPRALSCTPANLINSDLLVYYDFNNNLEDQIDNYSDGRYDLTGGTIKVAQGCGDGLTGYFDSSSGYAENRNFRDNDSTVGSRLAAGDFTITMWVNPDGDMPKFASALNTGFKEDMEPKDWQNKSQINIDGKGRIEWITIRQWF